MKTKGRMTREKNKFNRKDLNKCTYFIKTKRAKK